MTKKSIIMITVTLSIATVILLVNRSQSKPMPNNPQPEETNANQQNQSPRIISTKPDPLEGAIVPADGTIEITFNKSLENAPEFKTRIEPAVEYKRELSSDRKMVKIIFQKPLELGTTYTLFISPESKFDGGGKLDGEKIFHFKTITYRGV